MTNTPAIQTHDLTKSYGSLTAVRGLNLSVAPKRITAFLGQNGAGKSTTIKMLLGMTRPTSGDGTVLGKRITDPAENRELRRTVAYVAEDKPLYGYMTVEQTSSSGRRANDSSKASFVRIPLESDLTFRCGGSLYSLRSLIASSGRQSE